ncbi:hypothetical protein SS50377_26045 [Spironucleus salmonicida]|uniref:Uncharacterized protein n=1 Tax=Spironucleus salmonicida TaxID=348837 RepID=A0A9P8RWF0_9EUKA|nr:hypothetical protein SS50377_26045 [Spironucleus salmonicida]
MSHRQAQPGSAPSRFVEAGRLELGCLPGTYGQWSHATPPVSRAASSLNFTLVISQQYCSPTSEGRCYHTKQQGTPRIIVSKMVWFRSTQGIGWAAMQVERSNKIRVGLRYSPCVAYLGVLFQGHYVVLDILDIEVLGAPPAVQRDGEVSAELGGVIRIRSIQYYAPVPLGQAGHLAYQFVKLRRDALDLQQSAVVDVLLAVHRTRVGGEGDVHVALDGAQ